MLHILFVLLKIIGIILAVCLAVIILVLAAPIRYSFQFEKAEEDSPEGQIKVTWLCSILYFKASYINKIFDYQMRIFGYQILGNQEVFLAKKEKRRKQKEEKKQKKEAPGIKKKDDQTGKTVHSKQTVTNSVHETRISTDAEQEQQKGSIIKQPEKVQKEKEVENETSSGKKSSTTKKKFFSVKDKLISLKKKIHEFRQAYAEYNGQQLLIFLKESIIRLLKHLLPRNLHGYIRFGFDDPSATGMVTGLAAIFYPEYQKHFSVEPDFQDKCFEASCKGRGRIHIGFIIYMGIIILMNSDIRKIIRNVRS